MNKKEKVWKQIIFFSLDTKKEKNFFLLKLYRKIIYLKRIDSILESEIFFHLFFEMIWDSFGFFFGQTKKRHQRVFKSPHLKFKQKFIFTMKFLKQIFNI
jgi:hypothetical protein